MVPLELHKRKQPAIKMVLQRVRKDERKDKEPNKQVILFDRFMKSGQRPYKQMITSQLYAAITLQLNN
jgi:hypothetical protein